MVASLPSTAVWSGKQILAIKNLTAATVTGELIFTGSLDGDLKKWSITNGVLTEQGSLNLTLFVADIKTCSGNLFSLCYPVNTLPAPLQIIGVDPSAMQKTGSYPNVSAFTTTDADLVVANTDKNIYILDPADFTVKFMFTTNLASVSAVEVLKNSYAAMDYEGNLSVYGTNGALAITKKIAMTQPGILQQLDGNRLVLADMNPFGSCSLQIWRVEEEEDKLFPAQLTNISHKLVLAQLTNIPLSFCPQSMLVFHDTIMIAGSNGINLYTNNIDFTPLGIIPDSPISAEMLPKVNDSSFFAFSFSAGLWLYQEGSSDSKAPSNYYSYFRSLWPF